jgi:hypothetical protein
VNKWHILTEKANSKMRTGFLLLLLALVVKGNAIGQEECGPTTSNIPDCNCRPDSVNNAVINVIAPLLRNITQS